MSDRWNLGNSRSMTYTGAPRKGFPSVTPMDGSAPIPTKTTYEEGPNPEQEPEMMARLYSEAMGFENMAGNPLIAGRAKGVVLDAIRDIYNTMEFLRNKWLIEYRLYRGESMASYQYGRVQLHSPEPFKAVESIHPRLFRAIFDQEPFFRLHGEDWMDDAPAEQQQALCQKQLGEMDYRITADALLRDYLIYGTCAQKTTWEQEMRNVRYARAQRVPGDREGTSKIRRRPIEEVVMTFDGNRARQISIFDLLAPPSASSAQDAEWMGDRSLWPSHRIVQYGKMGLFKNLDELKGHHGENDANMGDEFKERKAYSYGVYDSREASLAPHIPHYTVIDWWGFFRISENENDPEVPCNITIIEPDSAGVVAVVRENPYWHGQKPYQMARYIKLHEELFGIGVIEPIVRLSYELDNKRNLYDAATQLESNPMYVLGDGANVPDGQLIARPGLCLRAQSPDDIKPLFTPKVSDAALQAMQDLKQEIRETHGVTSPLMAAESGGGSKTATQHTSEVNEGNMRILGAVKNFEDEILVPMLFQMEQNNQQFLSRARVINSIGPQGLRWRDRFTVQPESITGRFHIVPVVSMRLATQMVQTQQLINLLDRAMPINHAAGQEKVKVTPLLAKIFREGFGFRDVADFLALDPKDSGLLSAIEEHELWWHGKVLPVRDEDDHLQHWQSHDDWLKGEPGERLQREDPAIYDEAVAHQADHGKQIARLQEIQQRALMEAEQMRALQGGGGSEGGRGFADQGSQDPGSPKMRRESGMPKDNNGAAKSEGSQGAPNPGGS